MARQLAIARNTALAAVEQLNAEGYLETRRGAGTRVAAQISAELTGVARHGRAGSPCTPRLSRAGKGLACVARGMTGGEMPRAFLPGIPDLGSFPSALWGRLLRRAARQARPDALAYGHVAGLPELRRALCDHLRAVRGVHATAEQIIVTSSAQAALDLIVRALVDPGDRVWLEEPGYPGARAAFLGAGGAIVPVPVDGEGLNPALARGAGAARLIYLTPSHQYPTGTLMPLARRLEVLEFAERSDALVIEDDYDSEFQFQGRPVAALQGLDAGGRVIYVGTFSKVLQPGIRVGYAVVPAAIADTIARMQRNTGQSVPAAVQGALAAFIEEGHLRAHVRRMCALYRERQQLLAELLARHCRGRLRADVPAGGMQLAAAFLEEMDDRKIAQALAARGVGARPLSGFYLGPARRSGLFLGFAAYDRGEMEAGVREIAAVLDARKVMA
ncbi:MAG: PLP-dependent aminotransferase family protein [Methyloligellaceae bacterium]